MEIFENFLQRIRWLRAWQHCVVYNKGDFKMRREYALRFNYRKFPWQKELPIPINSDI